jgi:opacity protein-like surface antigen
MRSIKIALLATAAVAALSSATFAADLIVDTPSAPVIDNSFNWDGPYIGAFLQGQTHPSAFGLGVDFGVNALMDNILVGGEISGAIAWPNHVASGQGTVKIGGLISDQAAIYGYTGIGSKQYSSWYVPVGAGLEVAINDNTTIKGEAQYNFDLNHSSQNSATVKVGLNWHF